MTVHDIRKHFEIRARSDEGLERRIGTMCEAVHKQSGAVFGVKKVRTPDGACQATIEYQLPVASGDGFSQ